MAKEKNLGDCDTVEEVMEVKARNKKRFWDQKESFLLRERNRKYFLAFGCAALFAAIARAAVS